MFLPFVCASKNTAIISALLIVHLKAIEWILFIASVKLLSIDDLQHSTLFHHLHVRFTWVEYAKDAFEVNEQGYTTSSL